MTAVGAAVGVTAYYIACSLFIYVKTSSWRSRPQPVASEVVNVQSGSGKSSPSLGKKSPPDPPGATNNVRLSAFVRLNSSRGVGSSRPGDTNPFYSDCWHLSRRGHATLFLFGPILLPIRVVGVLLSLVAASLLSSVAVSGLRSESFACGSTVPLSGWRRFLVRWPLCFLGRSVLFFLGYHWIEERGRPAKLSDAPIVIANHLGPVEPLILAVRTGGMPVSKAENASLPLFGAVTRAFLPILVDRTNPQSRQLVREEIVIRAKGAASGTFAGPVFLFPEGTCTNGNSVITFKSGAFEPRLPIQPAVVEFPHSPGGFAPIFTVVSPSLPEIVFRMLCQPWNRCRITWLPVVEPAGDELTDWPGPKLYASRVQGFVAGALGSPTTHFAFEDVRLMQEARKLGDKYSPLARNEAAVEFRQVREAVGSELLDLDGAMRTLHDFHALDADNDGFVTFEEFQIAFEAEEGSHVSGKLSHEMCRRMFDLLDDDCSGRLNFREFLVGISVLQASSDSDIAVEDALKFCFKLYDTSNAGRMDFGSAQHILRVIHPDASVDVLLETFRDMDRNEDNMLAEDEFVAWVKRNGEMVQKVRNEMSLGKGEQGNYIPPSAPAGETV